MKLALIGFGKMGQAIKKLAPSFDVSIEVIIDPSHPEANYQTLPSSIPPVDAFLDFSSSTSIINHLSILLPLDIPILIGTTGWDKDIPVAQEMIEKHQGTVLYSPNFSVGILIFNLLMQKAAKLLLSTKLYEAAGLEIHHKEKKDTPSGTAILIESALNTVCEELKLNSTPPFSSIRCGTQLGTHTVLFDSPYDTITLSHQIKSRKALAAGAILATQWLQDKKGFFEGKDWINDWIKEKLS